MEKKNKRSILLMLLAVFIGLLSCAYLCVQRYYVENENMSIEQAMDYDAVVVLGRNEGYDLETTLEKCRQAGITSFTIYDTTLNKMTQRGECSLITRLGVELYYPQFHLDSYQYEYYLIGKPKDQKDLYFDELTEDLQLRLGKENAVVLDNPQYRILGLHGVMPALGEVNLGIMSADANRIASYGFNVILRPTNYHNVTAADLEHFFQRADKIRNVTGIMFVGKEVLGYSPDPAQRKDLLQLTADRMLARQMPFYMIESVNQLQYDNQDGMYDLAGLMHYDTGRVYAMAKEELEKITPEEAAMRFYISDLERNVRVNLFPMYKKPRYGQSLLDTNLSYISKVTQKLEGRGYHLDRASVLPVYYPNKVLLAIAAAAAACGFLFLLNLLVPLSDRVNYGLMVLVVLFGAGGAWIAKGALFLQMMAVGCAVTAPSAAILVLLDFWRHQDLTKKLGYGRVIRDGTLGLTAAVLMSMVGGIFIAAMLGNIRFFMEFDYYRGVKLTFILPIIIVAIGYLRRFPLMGHDFATSSDFISFAKDFLRIPIRMGTLILVGLLGLVAIVFVGRSGHTAGVPVPGIEVAMRRFLETVMYARPREKEFLIGHPAFFLMVAAMYRKWPELVHFFTVLAAVIGVGSMVETFAHIRTPFIMSFIRGLNGWLTGLVLGILLICAIAVVQYVTAWMGKRVKSRD
ncbi:hypothetical protein DW949_02915 [Megasphaera sp. AM44-1BH]|uniref:DUF5693 family protein n=1 Tax=Megasphaera sp. AM44-1BH TaxID=2292358 RepID=UPI000E523572|nr:DUF5693 family protein [Megasphaera sp. AM44-1BH]RHA15053.1 hypothetical protein DW949_02915 [Megasphaera sp. AM44-1BH]